MRRGVGEALGEYSEPDIFNADQGRQFTIEAFIGVLLDKQISKDGKGAWRDDVFVERL